MAEIVGEVQETESGFEWKIDHFWCLSEIWYKSPAFNYGEGSWHLEIWPSNTEEFDPNQSVHLCIAAESGDFPISLDISFALKNVNGEKEVERHSTDVFEEELDEHEFLNIVTRSELLERKDELVPSDALTVVCSLKIAKSTASASGISLVECCHCEEDFEAQIISSHMQKCLDKPIKCPECSSVVLLRNWYDHQCQTPKTEGDTAAAKCHSCKENLGSEFILLHKKCLSGPLQYPDYFSPSLLPRGSYDSNCQKEATRGESKTSIYSESQHSNGILHDLNQLFLSQEHCDVVLRVQEWEFTAHKAILAARSPVFASTFRVDMKEKQLGIVDIEDCDPYSFADFLRFLYCEDASNLSPRNVFHLYTTADKYDVSDLSAKCVEFMKCNLTVDSFCETLRFALQHIETDLIHSTTSFFIKNIEEILETVEWQSFAAENPTQSNELVIKYVKSVKHSNK